MSDTRDTRDAGRAVVIGSGAGGLASAVLLAQRGWSVTVLEQHVRAGGFLHRFFREGVGYDTGFHYIGSSGKDQLIYRVLGHLGVRDRLQIRPLDPDGFDWLRYPGLDVRVPAGIDRFGERLRAHFPHEAAGIAQYVERHKDAAGSYGWYNLDLSIPVDRVLRVEELTLRDVLHACFTDERLRAVVAGQAALYGVPPRDAPFGLHAIVTDHFLQGASTIAGGGDRVALELVRQLRQLGGRIQFRSRVEQIEVADGAAVAVHAGGVRYDADLVIANAHPKHVLDLLPADATRPAYRDRVRQAVPGRAHLGVYMRVNGDLSALANRNLYRFSSFDDDVLDRPATTDAVPFWFLTAPGARELGQGSAARGADQVVLALVQADWGEVRALGVDIGVPGQAPTYRSPEYERWKVAMLERCLSTFKQDFPDWQVERAEVSTPLTTWRYTGSPEGATYGHYHSVAQMGKYRLPMKVRVKNLLQVGHAVGFPGICGAMMSAYAAIGEIVGSDALVAELREVS